MLLVDGIHVAAMSNGPPPTNIYSFDLGMGSLSSLPDVNAPHQVLCPPLLPSHQTLLCHPSLQFQSHSGTELTQPRWLPTNKRQPT